MAISPSRPPSSHVPCTVTARLQQGVVLDVLFGTALDGLLASVIRGRAKAAASAVTGTLITGSLLDGGLHAESPAVVDLPLARCGTETDPDWHWMCTTAHPTGFDGAPLASNPDVHYQHSRVRERVLEHVALVLPASLPPSSGRYRMRRLPVVSTPAVAVTWQAVGDPAQIADLLTGLPAIGRRRGTGEGAVVSWEITAAPEHLDDSTVRNRYGHCHRDGTLGRPTPARCMHGLALPADREGVAGIRPPYWHPSTQHPVVLPAPL